MPTRVVVIQTDTPEETQAVAQAIQTVMGMGGMSPTISLPSPLPSPVEKEKKVLALPTLPPRAIEAPKKKVYPKCEICNKSFTGEERLRIHMENRHPRSSPKKEEIESDSGFVCEDCGRKFEKKQGLTRHRTEAHPESVAAQNEVDNPFVCATCNWRGASAQAVQMHKARMHSKPEKKVDPDY
jgi:DNA-directed RNA polymerase subunit RPC12/RpoP